MTTSSNEGLLGLYGDLCRLQTDASELVAALAALADDELLSASAHLQEDRHGIVELAQRLVTTEVEMVAARSAVADALAARRPDLPDLEAILTLYHDVTCAEHDVGELDATLGAAAANPVLGAEPDLAHLAEVLAATRERLQRDGGILREVERRLGQVIAGDG